MTSMNRSNQQIIQPIPLKIGDKIGLISTARKISDEELSIAIKEIEGWGFETVLAKSIYSSRHQFAGTNSERTDAFQELLNDPEIKAIICARGGYGTVKIIDKLSFDKFIQNPKWIAGYSDVTVLHSHLNQLNIASLHSTMPINFKGNTKETLQALKDSLLGKAIRYKLTTNPLNRNGIGKGQIVGGNLSILYSLLGSRSDINTDGKILFIEDLDEYLYHIDRMMTALDRSGKLSKLNGLIVGGMTQMHDNETPFGKNALEIILESVEKYDFPVCFDFPAGHISNNLPIKLGCQVELNVNHFVSLTYE